MNGIGPTPCDFLIIGEGPGQEEDRKGVPYVGKLGEELRRFFDGDSLPPLTQIFRTYIYRMYGGKDYEWTSEDLQRDEPEVLRELAETQPQVIITLGRTAARWFLGDVDMDEVHGLPWLLPSASKAATVLTNAADVVVFPAYSPAAGFRSPEASALVAYDFGQLALYFADTLKARKLHDDPVAKPTYLELTTPASLRNYEGISDIAEDSEGYPHAPWSIQFSHHTGFGFMLRELPLIDQYLRWLATTRMSATFHNSLHDRMIRRELAKRCGWSAADILFNLDTLPFDDTMVMAYLLQMEPQGLKALATRHANMAMQSFDELMGDKQNVLARDYLLMLWDHFNREHEEAQEAELARINSTPLRNPDGSVKRTKDGQIRYRKITKAPSLPKPAVFKAVERGLRSSRPHGLWLDQTEDVLDAAYRLAGDMPEATLDDVPFPKALYYGCRDADATVRVRTELRSRVKALGLEDVYQLELSTYPLIDRMMQVGMKPHLPTFEALSKDLEVEIADVQVRIETAVGREGFNANSGDQVDDYLFGSLGLDPIKKTPAGDRNSTNDKILEALEKEHGAQYPVIGDIREYRELFKLKNTFVDRIPDYVNRWPYDGRIHATFRTTRVITGRLAASDPNILAQPEHGKFAKAFKAGWVAEDGHVVCNWDLSQVELRVLAHLSGDPVLMQAYTFECPHASDWKAGKTICKRDECVLQGDLHARLAHQVFGLKPSQQDDSKHRLPAKTHNFGLAMGMTCYGLMIELRKNGIEVDEHGAQEWIDASNKLYAKVPAYKDSKIAEARRNGFVRCLSGRIRYIGGIRSRDERLRSEAERFAFSTPIQEGAQRSVKQAEAYIWTQILLPYYRDGWFKGGPRGRWVEPLVQVHDALKFEVAEGLERELHEKISYAMTKVPTPLRVPLGVEGKVGPNFRDMKGF